MSNLERRGTRNQRVDRGYRLTLATGTFSIVAVVAVILAIAGVVSFGWAVLAAVAAVVCAVLLRRLVSPR
jgi:hypothetical protein